VLNLTFRPIFSAGTTGVVTSPTRTLADWQETILKIYPLVRVEAREGPPFTPSRPLGADDRGYDNLLDELEVQRLLGNYRNRGYVYGVFSGALPAPMTGLGFVADPARPYARSAIGWDGLTAPGYSSKYTFHDTFAHELGHNLGRSHAPCGGVANPDRGYPHKDALIGADGMDVANQTLISGSAAADIMSYCPPRWVSDYTYTGILRARNADAPFFPEARREAQREAQAQDSLLVSGRVEADGSVTLHEAFQVPQPPERPEPGEYTLVCRDGAGRLLQEVAFAASAIADLPQGGSRGSFFLMLPLTPELQSGLASLAVTRHGLQLAERRPSLAQRTDRAMQAVRPSREPYALVWQPGVVHLGWDPATHPRVVIKDAATGEVLAMGRDGALELATTATELELLLSDGLRTTTCRVPVRN